MPTYTDKGSQATNRRSEATEVRLLVAVLFPWFFTAAVGRKVLHLGGDKTCRLSCFEEARRSTYSIIPFALMR